MKKDIIRLVLVELEKERGNNQLAFKKANAEAIAAEGAMQSRYSTFKEEAQEMAIAYAKRMNDIGATIESLQRILNDCCQHSGIAAVNSLIQVKRNGGGAYFLVLLGKGGYTFAGHHGMEICVVNKASPIAVALLGRRVGEKVQLPPDGEEWEVESIQ